MKPPEPVVSAMDMHATLPTVEAGRLNLVLDRITSGTDVLVVTGHEEGRMLLDAVAQRLAGSRQRAIRVSVPAEGLSLSGLMAGITGRRDLAAHDDAVLELGFRTLTGADETCDGTVLLVSGADGLQRPALRYIQFACRAAKELRVVLAGTAELADTLANDELAALRTRLVALPAVMPALAVASREPASASRTRRVPGWAIAGLGMAASLALGLWVGRSGPQPPVVASVSPSPVAARVADAPTLPVVAPQPAPTPAPPTQAAAAPTPAAPVEAVPRPAPRVAEAPAQPAVVPATPTPVADLPSIPVAVLPLPPPVAPSARPVRATPPRRLDTRAIEAAAARRFTPTQRRGSVVARPPSEPIRLDDGGEDGPVRPPRSWQPEDTFGPMYSSLGRPRSFVGTYSANPDGTRTFRTEP